MDDLAIIGVTAAVGLGSSLITLIITKIIDISQEKKKFKRELFKLIFERKTSVVENAMSWYQEALDNYRMLQMSCTVLQEGREDYAMARLYIACQHSDKLFKEAPPRLNPIYLYYDFSKVEQKYKSSESIDEINDRINKIAILIIKIQSAESDRENTGDSKQKLKKLLLSLADSFNSQINVILEIQAILRNGYKISL